MHTVPVTLSDMLAAREARQKKQAELTEGLQLPLVCFTMNLAGEIKDTPAVRYAFSCGLSELLLRLGTPVHQEIVYGKTGCEAYLAYAHPAVELKATALQAEDTEIGRLYDVDVLDRNGVKLSRTQPRLCLVCEEPAAACARSRRHGLATVLDSTRARLWRFCADSLAAETVRALWDEVRLTPKPGLVDSCNNGAHTDMDLRMFENSAEALRPYFAQAFLLGTDADCGFSDLQRCGLDAEAAMLAVTGGVNTHKGAIYGLLLLLAAFGRASWDGGDVFAYVRAFCMQDTRAREQHTHGTAGFLRYGAVGARGEALMGFPHAQDACTLLRTGDALDALLYLLSEVADTNVLYRGGEEALRFLQDAATDMRLLTHDARQQALCELDRACIVRNISPGGCADILAMALLLDRTRVFWEEETQA